MIVAEEKYDNILYKIANQHVGGLPDFLKTIASFLRRKTDFFTGASAEEWEKLLLGIFRNEQALAEQTIACERVSEEEDEDEACAVQAPKPSVSSKVAAVGPIGDGPDYSRPITEADVDEMEKSEIGKLMPNAGNGCTLEKYTWTQTLEEIDLKIPCKRTYALRARDVDVIFGKKSLLVSIKGEGPLVDGELGGEIKQDECIWVLQDGHTVAVTLSKLNKSNWWDRLISTDTAISLRKVNPEPSKLSEVDDSTRSAVEKMMYEQRQKQMGNSGVVDQQKKEMIEKFKSQHPEMDFSKCKYNWS